MWFAARLIGTALLGVLLGLASAYVAVTSLRGENVVSNGPWSTNLATGGADADIYTRAYVALTGLFALNKNETIYYGADKDSGGAPLDGHCSYRIEGSDPDARWWSITLYAADDYLIPNAANRYSLSKTSIVRQGDGGFVIRLSTVPETGNWIPTSPDGFQVTLRLYNPGQAVRDNPAGVALPSITKEACS